MEINEISDKIYNKIRELGLSGGHDSEYMAWQNSLNFKKNVLDDNDIPIDCSIAIEYQIPRTSKRVGFMIAGADQNDKDNIIIIELKQWERAEQN